jgi:pyruvate dehydrogenase E1 component beta subunit
VPIGSAAVRREGTDLTVVTWGGAAPRAVAALDLVDDVSVELIDLRTISPWDRTTVLDSVRKTGRLLVVHDAVVQCGVGAEIAAVVAEECFDSLKAPVRRLGAPFAPPPFAPHLEDAYLPQPGAIARVIHETVQTTRRVP